MRAVRLIAGLIQQLRGSWLGPHFYHDLIRLARKGWPTLARVIFLAIVLVSLLVMNRTQGDSVHFTQPAEFARRAQNFAYLLLVLQDLLVLAILPVYVASSIVEEKENQTLEALTLTHLTDRELVLGKLAARLVHVGGFALANFPLLAFMHLWGNVDAVMLFYHEVNLFLMLVSAGSVCIWISTWSDSVFQAILTSYGCLALMGFVAMLATFALPWAWGSLYAQGSAHYWPPLFYLVFIHGLVAFFAVRDSINRIEVLRREERRKPRKTTGALTLTDNRPISKRVGKRGQAKSRIHPLAMPVWDNAVFWKECIKDGTTYSLSLRWLWIGLALVLPTAGLFRLVHLLFPPRDTKLGVLFLALSFTLSSYLIGLVTYALVVVFQLSMCVVGEREQGTLPFLLTIPADRREIFWLKWLGPWWRNWPIVAVAYLGAVLGFGSGVFGWKGAIVMALLPWPFLLMMGCWAFWLSVVCRRVLYANIAVVGFLGLLLIAHIAVAEDAWFAASFFLAIISGEPITTWAPSADMTRAALLALGQQLIFLAVAGLCLWHGYWVFRKKDYSA